MPDLPLSDLQLAILRILWDRGEATAADVHTEVCERERDLAPTTVATMLSRLEKRGLVGHRTRGRQFVYRAVVAEHDVRRSMLRRVTDFFFGGETSALLSHLVDIDHVDAQALAEVRRLLRTRSDDDREPSSRESDDDNPG
jgi:BlaI family transcriptional regulator, penicillinase repressor